MKDLKVIIPGRICDSYGFTHIHLIHVVKLNSYVKNLYFLFLYIDKLAEDSAIFHENF